MSLFRCEECGCVENTALCMVWLRGDGPALCSECDPEIGGWHGAFPKVDADAEGYRTRKEDPPFIAKGEAA